MAVKRYCDFCGEEMPIEDVRFLLTIQGSNPLATVEKDDLCEECRNKIMVLKKG